MLIALITEGDCAASRLLNTMGINVQKIYVDVIAAMGEDPAKFRDEIQKRKQVNGSDTSTPILDQYSRD